MTLSNLRKIAIHEAGHAVAHNRFGLDRAGATIVPDEESGFAGAAAGEGVEHVWEKEQAEKVVLAFCAGYAALMAAGHVEEAPQGAGSDFDQAGHLIEHWALDGTLESWMNRAVLLMSTPENVGAAALVAEHLLEHKSLDGDYIDMLVDVADGNVTQQEWAEYLALRRGLLT